MPLWINDPCDMPQETTLNEVLEAVQTLAGHVDAQLADVRSEMKAGFADVRSEMNSGFAGVRSEIAVVRHDLADTKNELITEIDRFVVLHQTLDVELASLRSRCERMEIFMVRVGKKLDMEYEKT
jgi:hypothetical protein